MRTLKMLELLQTILLRSVHQSIPVGATFMVARGCGYATRSSTSQRTRSGDHKGRPYGTLVAP